MEPNSSETIHAQLNLITEVGLHAQLNLYIAVECRDSISRFIVHNPNPTVRIGSPAILIQQLRLVKIGKAGFCQSRRLQKEARRTEQRISRHGESDNDKCTRSVIDLDGNTPEWCQESLTMLKRPLPGRV